MNCVICKHGKTSFGKTTVTLEREQLTVVFKNIPAEICQNCGEEYLDDTITKKLLKTAEEAANSGVQVDVRQFVVAQ